MVLQLLRAHDVFCPTYSKLREADKSTVEYKQVEQDNQVNLHTYIATASFVAMTISVLVNTTFFL